MAPPPAHLTSPSNQTPPIPEPIQARIPTSFEVLQITAVAAEWQEKWDESRPADRNHKAIWIEIRERHEKKVLEELPQDSKDTLERVWERLLSLSQGLEEEVDDEAARLTDGLQFLTGSLAFDHRTTVTEALKGVSDVEVLEFVRGPTYEFGNLLKKWGQTSSTIGSSTNQSSSAASATSASAAHNQRGSLRVGLASRNTGAQVSGKRKKIVRCKTKGKNMGRWGNKDNNRKRVFANQGARSQFENAFDKNLSENQEYQTAFLTKLYEELADIVKDASAVDPSPLTMEARHFIPISLINNLVSPTDEKPTVPGWAFVQLLEGQALLDHYRNTGPFNPRNGLAMTLMGKHYADSFEMSFIPLTEDDPAQILNTFKFIVVPHSPSAAVYLHKHNYKPRQVLTIENHSELHMSNHKLADVNDLPNPVDMLFHHHACSIFRFRAAEERVELEAESDEEDFVGLEGLCGVVEDKAEICRNWLKGISSFDVLEPTEVQSSRLKMPKSELKTAKELKKLNLSKALLSQKSSSRHKTSRQRVGLKK